MSTLKDKILEKSTVPELGRISHIDFVKIQIVMEEVGFSHFRFKMYYEETPKRGVFHVFDQVAGNEIFVKPKFDLDALIKKVTNLNEYKFEFAKRI
jgi:hypothetical protein